jgi:hypothetical protein
MQTQSLQEILHGRCVSLNETVARELHMFAIQGFTALRRRGLEVGGLLLGHSANDELRVESFQEVPCEHRYGPSYALSDTDRENLTALLAQSRTRDAQVIGAFRSFTGRDPVVEPADEALVAEHFSHGDFLLIFLHPLSAENCVTSFHLFRDGHLLPADEQSQLLPAPKPTPEPDHPRLVPPRPIVADEPSREHAPLHTEPLRLPTLIAEPEARPRRSGLWKAALICLATVLAGSLAYELGRADRPVARPAAQWAELNLDARPAAGKLQITWDANAVRSVSATRGALTISDGNSQQEIELGPAQVAAGTYDYAAERPDLTIRLTLSAGHRTVASESTRLTSSVPTAPPPAPAVAAPALSTELAPSAVHEVQPRVPEGIRSRLTGQIMIDVDVTVSDHGRVIRAKAKAPGSDGLRRYLAGLAETAAREWRFTPARTRDGNPVAASKTIQFVFTP